MAVQVSTAKPTYDPYGALKQIYNYKKAYNTAKAANDSAGMQNASTAAQSYYAELRDNGYGEYADRMQNSTEQQAADWVNNYLAVPETPTLQNAQEAATRFEHESAPAYGVTPQYAPPAVQSFSSESIYQNVDPAAYDLIKNIVGAKSQYDNSKFIDGTNDYETIANNAIQYYDALRSSGRSDIADYLSGADTASAVSYLNSLGIDTSDISGGANTADMNAMLQNLINGQTPSVSIESAWEQSKPMLDYVNGSAPEVNLSEAFSQMLPILEYLKGNTQTDPAAQAANQAALNNMNALFGTLIGNNAQINDNESELMDMIAQYTGEQTGRYEDLYNYIKNENFYDTDTAKAILGQYNALGLDAMDEAAANGIASNSGNIDSYAAANALRQQLDFTNAGNRAVLDQYNSNIGNMLSTLQSLGVDVGNAHGQMAGLIGDSRDYNLGLLGGYNDGTKDALDAFNNNSQYNAAVQLDALNALLGAYTSGKQLESNQYSDQLGAVGDILGLVQSGITNDTSKQNTIVNALANIISGRDTNASAERQLSAANAANLDMLNAELASNERISANELAQAMELAGINRELTLAELENAYRIASEGNASNERISASQLATALQEAALNAEIEKYVAGLNSETNKYVAGLDSATNKYIADTEAASDKYKVDAEKEMNQATIDANNATSQDVVGVGSLNPHDYTLEEQISLFGSVYEDVKKENPNLSDAAILSEAQRRYIKSWGLEKDAEKEYAEFIESTLLEYFKNKAN